MASDDEGYEEDKDEDTATSQSEGDGMVVCLVEAIFESSVQSLRSWFSRGSSSCSSSSTW